MEKAGFLDLDDEETYKGFPMNKVMKEQLNKLPNKSEKLKNILSTPSAKKPK
jgi:hypothetical protein